MPWPEIGSFKDPNALTSFEWAKFAAKTKFLLDTALINCSWYRLELDQHRIAKLKKAIGKKKSKFAIGYCGLLPGPPSPPSPLPPLSLTCLSNQLA